MTTPEQRFQLLQPRIARLAGRARELLADQAPRTGLSQPAAEARLTALELFTDDVDTLSATLKPLTGAFSLVAADKAFVAAHAEEVRAAAVVLDRVTREVPPWRRDAEEQRTACERALREITGDLRAFERILQPLHAGMAADRNAGLDAARQSVEWREIAIAAVEDRDAKTLRAAEKAITALLPPILDRLTRLDDGLRLLDRQRLKLGPDDPLLRNLMERWDGVKTTRNIVRLHVEDVQRNRVAVQDLKIRPVDLDRAAAVLGTAPSVLAPVFADRTVREIGRRLEALKILYRGRPAPARQLVAMLRGARLL